MQAVDACVADPSINCRLKKWFKSMTHNLTSMGGPVKREGSLHLIRFSLGMRSPAAVPEIDGCGNGAVLVPVEVLGARPRRSIGGLPRPDVPCPGLEYD